MNENNEGLRIEMLGGFTIISEGRRLVEQSKKPSKVWKLVQYLVTHRGRAVSQEELLDVFCNDEKKGNPGSVLRTMVYRARNLLDECGLDCADEIINAKSGCYSWNNNIKCTTDIEDIEEFTKHASVCSDENEKLEFLLKAVNLYRGDFLQGSSGDMWVLPMVRWYRSLYINAVHEALDLLMKHERITDAEELSTRALGIDPFDEYLIFSYLRTMLVQRRYTEALEVYRKMETMFYDELGISFSDGLQQLYQELQDAEITSSLSLEDLVAGWLEDTDNSNIFYCSPGDFKILCQVEARSAARTGRTTYIIRFNTKHDTDPKIMAKGGGVMRNLENAIMRNLRTSDIYTRSSPSQYMIMLRQLTYEDCKAIITRILSGVDSKYLTKITDTSIIHVTPPEVQGQVSTLKAETFSSPDSFTSGKTF